MTRFPVGFEDDLCDGWRDIVHESLSIQDGLVEQSPQALKLTRDLRDLSPEIYLGVEVELIGSSRNNDFEADEARIRKIRVKAAKWDGVGGLRAVRC